MAARAFTRRSLLAGAAGAAVAGALGSSVRAPAAAAALSVLPQTLPAGPGQPPIVAREAWAQGRCPPRVAPEYGALQMAFVHHTENPNGYQVGEVAGMLRAIYQFHRYGRGWNDIGYNFVVDRFGRIFEARAGGVDEAIIGAQAGGYNHCSTGVAVLGEYGATQISPAARAALAHLLAWKLSLHGIPIAGRVTVRVNPAGAVYSRFPAGAHVSLPRVAGHRDADSTTCPGDALYGELPGLRAAAEGLAGRVARLTLAVRGEEAGAPPGAGGAPVPSGVPMTLAGALALLNGAETTAIAGAPVEIQARSVSHHGQLVREQIVAQAQTASDGSFAVPIGLTPGRPGVWLRALCAGATGIPAAVSPPIHLAGSVAPTTPPATNPPATNPPATNPPATPGGGPGPPVTPGPSTQPTP
jgi:N-acetylmuramoyl-L-alanine amidase